MIKKIFSKFSKNIAVDLGTANSLVYVEGKGIVISEPSVVAINKKTGRVLAIGDEAKRMVGKTPAHIVAIYPLHNGVISDFEVAQQMLRYFIDKVQKENHFFFRARPRVIIGIPCGVTEVEKKAAIDAAKLAGARDVFLIEQPVAAAIGARLPIQDPGGNFIVDIGGGTTEIAVISLGGIVLSKSLKVAGNELDESIIDFCREEYKILIGPRTAERVKIEIGSVIPLKEKMRFSLRGRNVTTGLPEEVIVTDADIRKAIEKPISQMVREIKETVENTPPELISDIMSRGIYLTGGGSLLRGLDTLISKEIKIPTRAVDDPLTCVVRGAGIVLENIDNFNNVLVEAEELEPPK